MSAEPDPLTFEDTILIHARPARVLRAFFDPADLSEWWEVARSVTMTRPMGIFAVQWGESEYRDDLLGPLGGTFHGTVMEYRPGQELFVADAYWHPPQGAPLGPMALEVTCIPEGRGGITTLRIRQSANEDGPRWVRYFEIVSAGWAKALEALRRHLEAETYRK